MGRTGRLAKAELGTLEVRSAGEWRLWLKENHLTNPGVWLVYHRAGSGIQSVSYDDSVDEALAFGWIDSIIRKIDDKRYARKFTPRRPGSIWSKSNLDRVERLREEGRMTKWGKEVFDRRTGVVSLLERFNAQNPRGAEVPRDLEEALRANPQAWANFSKMAPSHRRRYLLWISGAKKPETRSRRIREAVVLLARNVKNLLK